MGDTRDEETRDNASVWWDEDGERWVYRASGLGNCIGALVRMRMGVDGEEAPAWMQEKWDQGKQHENTVLDGITDDWELLSADEMRDLGLTVDALGQAELEVKIPGGSVVVCHPDGLARNAHYDGLVVVEAKALSEGYAKTVAKALPPFYAWQTSVEVAGLKKLGVKEILWVTGVKDEDGGKITRVEQKIIEPMYTTADIVKRVREVERYADDGDVPFCEFRQYPCAFWLDHDSEDPLWKEIVQEVDDEEDVLALHVAAQEYEAMKVGEKECKDDKQKAAKKIAEIADKLGVHGGKLKTDQYIINDVVQQRKGAVVVEQVFDELGLDKALLTDDVLDKCRVQYETRYPTVKKIKKEGE